jgi:hypothetical protein
MNKLIEGFLEKHGFIHPHMTTGERSDAIKKYQLLVELVIKECCDQISVHQQVHNSTDIWSEEFVWDEGYNSGLQRANLTIQQRFDIILNNDPR